VHPPRSHDDDGALVLVRFDENDGIPCGKVKLTAYGSRVVGLHVYECEETAQKKGIASVDLDLERVELLLRHLDAWARKARQRVR